MKRNNNSNKYFVNGPINSGIIAGLISNNQSKHDTGALCIFLGQVRADKKDGSKVRSIHYSAYLEMAEKEIDAIKQNVSKKLDVSNIAVLHSIGEVRCGEISVLVLVSSAHRRESIESLGFIINEIKTKVPVWKKEIYEDGSFRWTE